MSECCPGKKSFCKSCKVFDIKAMAKEIDQFFTKRAETYKDRQLKKREEVKKEQEILRERAGRK